MTTGIESWSFGSTIECVTHSVSSAFCLWCLCLASCFPLSICEDGTPSLREGQRLHIRIVSLSLCLVFISHVSLPLCETAKRLGIRLPCFGEWYIQSVRLCRRRHLLYLWSYFTTNRYFSHLLCLFLQVMTYHTSL
jgi:hypothetical protein